MKQFLKKISLYILIPSFFGLMLFYLSGAYITFDLIDNQIDKSVKHIIIGDSHINQAFDERFLPESKNIATTSESIYFSYYKLKAVLDKHSSIENVFLGLSYHNISNYYDRFISGRFSASTAPKYFYLLPADEKMKHLYWNSSKTVPFLKGIAKQGMYKSLAKRTDSFLGGFSNEFERSTVSESLMDRRLVFQFYTEKKLNPFSELNIDYLSKIVELCDEKNVELYAVNTPLHTYYHNRIPQVYVEKLNELIEKHQLNYIDFSTLNLSDSCFTPDGDHVSVLGAKRTSTELKKQIFKVKNRLIINTP
ncbi:MAG: hypothetical protein ACPG4W_00915 [Flavobacteriales bacterium]